MTISTSEAGKQLAAARKQREKKCAFCGKSFVTVGRGLYCSQSCIQKAKRARAKANL
jgi:hypothetical protein